jgi:hypothetical protein
MLRLYYPLELPTYRIFAVSKSHELVEDVWERVPASGCGPGKVSHPSTCTQYTVHSTPLCSRAADPGCWSRIRILSIPDPWSYQIIKKCNPKIVFKLSEIWSGLFIPDQDFLPIRIPDPGVKRVPDPGSGSGSGTLLSCTMFFFSLDGRKRDGLY